MDVHVQRTVPISYEMVAKAYQKVKQGGKSAGVDGQSWHSFAEAGVEKQLYKIWNRLSSGSYFPQAVLEKEIPKKNGKKRKLGIPTLSDRIAQEVIRHYMEIRVDHLFHEHSYGYRPVKSSHEALKVVRQNTLERDWVVDLDITQFFDEIDHELMMRAIGAIFTERWISVYVERWLKMKIEGADGTQYDRGTKGTPQGGVISPLLANMFLHFGLDMWLTKHFPSVRFVRYADDIVLHCESKEEAEQVLQAIKTRLEEIHLRINEEKTKIVYCQDYARKDQHEHVQFGFLGFSFQPRAVQDKHTPGTSYTGFTGEISRENQVKIRAVIRESIAWRNTTMTLSDIALLLNKKLCGWIHYFSLFGKRQLRRTLLYVDVRLIKWLRRRHKIGHRRVYALYQSVYQSTPRLFYHWQCGYSYVTN
jgi:group II intron reverse transcriptase/maturase